MGSDHVANSAGSETGVNRTKGIPRGAPRSSKIMGRQNHPCPLFKLISFFPVGGGGGGTGILGLFDV